MVKSPTKEQILADPEVKKISGFGTTKLFWAETPEAVDAYVKAGVKINHKDIAETTALDSCIDRVVRNINTFEDSDNKGAVLSMVSYGGICEENSLESLKKADPEFYKSVLDAKAAYAVKQQKLANSITR